MNEETTEETTVEKLTRLRKHIYSGQEAADKLGVSIMLITKLRQKGVINSVKLGKAFLYHKQEIDHLAQLRAKRKEKTASKRRKGNA